MSTDDLDVFSGDSITPTPQTRDFTFETPPPPPERSNDFTFETPPPPPAKQDED